MAFDQAKLKLIFARTDGHCHICRKKLCFNNYGTHGARGAWHVEHSKARANGGTDHRNNLYAACIACNLEKGTHHSRTARSWNGYTKAPLSKEKKQEVRARNMWIGGAGGFALGAVAVGTAGAAVLLGSLGVLVGKAINPES